MRSNFKRLKYLPAYSLAFLVLALTMSCGEEPEAYYIGAPSEYRAPIEMALDQLNEQGGIDGRELRAVFEQGQEGETGIIRAATIADRLSSDSRVLAVIGHTGSTDTLTAGHIYNRRQVVHLIPGASSPLLIRLGEWSFRMSVSDEAQGKFCAEVAFNNLVFRKTAVVFANDDYGKHLARTFIESFEDLEGQVGYTGWYSSGGLIAIDSVASRVVNGVETGECDSIFFAGGVGELEYLLRALKESDSETTVLCGDACLIFSRIGRIEELSARNRVFCTTYYYPYLDEPVVVQFRQVFLAKYNREPEVMDALIFDAVKLLAPAILQEGGEKNAVRDYLAGVGISYESFKGVTGEISFFANGESRRPVTVVEYKTGLPVLVSAMISPSGE